MDTETQHQNEDLKSEACAANDVHLTSTDEGSKPNGAISDVEKQAVPRRSAFALINRRIRLFFRPWKWRRKNRSKRTKDAALKGLYTGKGEERYKYERCTDRQGLLACSFLSNRLNWVTYFVRFKPL